MKKLVLVLSLLLAIWGVVYHVLGFDRSSDAASVTQSETIEVTKKQQQQPSSLKKIQVSETTKVHKPTKSKILKKDSFEQRLKKQQECVARYESQPEWLEIESIITDIYQTGREAAGKSAFQQLPIDSLKSYADAGDRSAMFHYGSALMWKGGIGIYLNYQGDIERLADPEKYKSAPKNHKPDLQLFDQGAEYAYSAAIKGKFGGIMEVAFMKLMMVRRMQKHNFAEEQILEQVVSSASYLKLLKHIHSNDKVLVSEMNYDYFITDNIKNIWDEDIEKLKNKVESLSDKAATQLIDDWTVGRESLGLDTAPDLLSPELERFYREHVAICNEMLGKS